MKSRLRDNDGKVLTAVRAGDNRLVKKLLEQGESPNRRDRHRVTPLIESASRGNHIALSLLVNAGADVNAENTRRESAVAYAAANGDVGIVKQLLEAGGSPNCWIDIGAGKLSALSIAAGRGYLKVVDTLLAGGASIEGWREQERPLVLAARNGHLDVVQSLIKQGADPNGRGTACATALMPLAACGRVDGIEFLLSSGADVNASNSDGMTALMFACKCGDFESVKLLVKNGADPLVRDTFRRHAGIRDNALNWAINNRHQRLVKWLIAQRFPFERIDLEKAKALSNAA